MEENDERNDPFLKKRSGTRGPLSPDAFSRMDQPMTGNSTAGSLRLHPGLATLPRGESWGTWYWKNAGHAGPHGRSGFPSPEPDQAGPSGRPGIE